MPSSNTIDDKGRLPREAMWFQLLPYLEKAKSTNGPLNHKKVEQTRRWRRCQPCHFLRTTIYALPRGLENPGQNGHEKIFFKEIF
jgi:hypothetical protein